MANKYNFDQIVDRRKLHSYKWDVKDNEISLSVADSDFVCFPEIKKSLLSKVDDACFGYTYVPDEYFDAYSYWWKKRYDVNLERKNFIFCSSIVASIDVILKRVTSKGDKVLMLTPIYNVFFNCIKNNELTLNESQFVYGNNSFSIDWEDFENKLKESKVFILCNPHNPIGIMFSLEEINRFVSLCKKYNVFLISDEIHCDYDYNEKKYVSVLKIDDSDYERLIALFSPGKTFNVAGLHSSVIYIKDDNLRELIQNGVYEDDVGEPNYFAIDPVIKAYTLGEQYVYELNEYIKENRDLLKEYFVEKKSNLKIIDNDATYLLWVDISYYGLSSIEFTKLLRQEFGVVVCSGEIYGDSGRNFFRVNLATNKTTIKEFCNRLMKFEERLKK